MRRRLQIRFTNRSIFMAVILVVLGSSQTVANAVSGQDNLTGQSETQSQPQEIDTKTASKKKNNGAVLARSTMKRMIQSGPVTYSFEFRGEGTAAQVFPTSVGKAVIVPGKKPGLAVAKFAIFAIF